jgi:hypothetical protein
MVVIGGLSGFGAQVLSGRAATPIAGEAADQLIEDLEADSASFVDRDEARNKVFGVLWNEMAYNSGASAFYMLALCGVGLVVFGLFPSRKRIERQRT